LQLVKKFLTKQFQEWLAVSADQTKYFDVVIVGGGHNGLVASCYLAKAGLKVAILEKNEALGGATVSQKVFPEYEARLSRYSYLVSLLPDQIVKDLGLKFKTIEREVSSFTPENQGGKDLGLLINRGLVGQTGEDFQKLTGNEEELKAWENFYQDVQKLADAIAPTMLQKLPTRSELREKVSHKIWDEIIESPLEEVLESRFKNDLVRGIVLTDGLIGTFASAKDMSSNICFLYHLIGNGTGDWKVPLGGMGAFVAELIELAKAQGVAFFLNSEVSSISSHGDNFLTTTSGQIYESKYVLANFAPQKLAETLNSKAPSSLEGSQVKVNMLLTKLPRLKSGADPKLAFAGTFHFDERYSDFQRAYDQAAAGEIPQKVPAEMYCHTLSDPSILDADLVAKGYQTLTLFGMHTPAQLFEKDNSGAKAVILERLLNQLNQYLLDPIESCLAKNSDGSLCIEIKSPLDLEKEIGLPRGNIFHKDLSMPFREDGSEPSWGVETEIPNLFLCGAGAIRGGGVSGIPGHNAAAAVLEAHGL
jgi:phytoene dehydrogenase-like protein